MVKIECVVECKNWLGEGPVWDVKERAFPCASRAAR